MGLVWCDQRMAHGWTSGLRSDMELLQLKAERRKRQWPSASAVRLTG